MEPGPTKKPSGKKPDGPAAFFFRGVVTLLPVVLTLVIFGLLFQMVDRYVTGPINSTIYWSLERNALGWKALDVIGLDPLSEEYLDMAALPPEYAHEPALALAAGKDGLDVIRRIIQQATDHLEPGGGLLAEIGRCRPAFETSFPDLQPVWIETETSTGEVLWLTAAQVARPKSHAGKMRK